ARRSRLGQGEDGGPAEVVKGRWPRVGHGPLRQIERREALDGELPGRDGRVRERDTEASFRKAAHAVFGVRNAHAEHYDTECDDEAADESRAYADQPQLPMCRHDFSVNR